MCGCRGIEAEKKHLAELYGPRIERNLAALPAIADQLRRLPPLTEDRPVGLPDLQFDSFCHAEDLANPDELGMVWARLGNAGLLNQCASFLHRGHAAFDPTHVQATLRGLNVQDISALYPRCADSKTLLVIRSVAFLAPSGTTQATAPFVPIQEIIDLDAKPAVGAASAAKKQGEDREAKDSPAEAAAPDAVPGALAPVSESGNRIETRYTFQGGYLRAELLAFELPSAKLLGGVRFTTQGSVKVNGKTIDLIRDDFADNLATSVRHAVERLKADAEKAGQP